MSGKRTFAHVVQPSSRHSSPIQPLTGILTPDFVQNIHFSLAASGRTRVKLLLARWLDCNQKLPKLAAANNDVFFRCLRHGGG